MARSVGADQVGGGGAEAVGEFVEGDDGGVAAALFELAYILLAEARALGELLLRQAGGLAEARGVSADELAHVHAGLDGRMGRRSLSTIVCEGSAAGSGFSGILGRASL